MKYWVMVSSRESYEVARKHNVLPFYADLRSSTLLDRVAVGDRFVFYITKEKRFAGTFSVESRPRLDESRIFGDHRDGEWNQRLDIRPVGSTNECDVTTFVRKLEFTYGKANWGLYLLRTLFEISPGDFDLISKNLSGKSVAAKH